VRVFVRARSIVPVLDATPAYRGERFWQRQTRQPRKYVGEIFAIVVVLEIDNERCVLQL
jgi:hypothetical protein